MEGESNQSMKQEQKERKKEKGKEGGGRGKGRGEETWEKQIAEGGVFVSFDFRATGKTAGWDMVEWRKGLGTGRCSMNAPHVDYTERRTPAGEQSGSHLREG